MKTQTKKVKGQLLEVTNNELLADVSADVTLQMPQNENDQAKYEVYIIVNGYKPELSDKSHILKLNDELSGRVFITIEGIPGTQTRYKCFLQDEIWNKLAWFQAL